MLPDACFCNQWGTPHARGISEERRCGICWRILHLYYTVCNRRGRIPLRFKPEGNAVTMMACKGEFALGAYVEV